MASTGEVEDRPAGDASESPERILPSNTRTAGSGDSLPFLPLARFCTRCGAAAKIDQRFCSSCGAPLALPGLQPTTTVPLAPPDEVSTAATTGVSRRPALAALGVALVAAGGGAGWWVQTQWLPTTRPATARAERIMLGEQRAFPAPRMAAPPVWSPDGKWLAWITLPPPTTQYGAESQLHVAPADGSGSPQIVSTGLYNGGDDYQMRLVTWRPVWSPDGAWLAVTRYIHAPERPTRAVIEVMRRDGSERKQLTAGDWAWWPSWSADGKRITVTKAIKPTGNSSDDEVLSLASIEVSTGREEAVPVGGEGYMGLSSSRTDRLAYLALTRETSGSRGRFTRAQLLVKADKDKAPLALTTATDVDAGYTLPTSWSPNGALLASLHTGNSAGSDTALRRSIQVMRLREVGRSPGQELAADKVFETAASTGLVSWSPDSGKFAFDRPNREGWADVYLANADGTGVTQLTTDGRSGAPMWAPDGSQLAVVTFDPATNQTGIALWTLAVGDRSTATPVPTVTRESGRTLSSGGAARMVVLDRGRRDEWTFAASAGQVVRLDMWAPAPFVGSSFDTFLELRDPAGRLVAEDDDGHPDGFNSSRIEVRVPFSGNYRVIARALNDDAEGLYRIRLEDLGARGGAALTTGRRLLSGGATGVGRLENGALDEWQLGVSSNNTVRIELVSPAPNSGASSGFDTFLELRDGSNRIVNQDDDGLRNGQTILGSLIQTRLGTSSYKIVVRSYSNNASGTYQLQVTDLGR